MLVRVWGKEIPYSLLVGVQTCTATMEISVVVPQEDGDSSTSRASKEPLHPTTEILVHCCSSHKNPKFTIT